MVTSNGTVTPEDEPYTFLIHTGANHPNCDKTSKWDDGCMKIIVNPGSNTESRAITVTEKFPVNREDHVRADVWLPQLIGEPKLIKVDVMSHYYELEKGALYVREVTVLYKRRRYRFPINNYLYPHNPLRGNPTAAKLGCPPHVFSRTGPGTLKSGESEDYILKAREEDLLTTRSMVPWSEDQPDLKVPRYVSYDEYEALPRFLKFKEAKLDAFETMRHATRHEVKVKVIANKLWGLIGMSKLKHLSSFEAYREFIMKNAHTMHLDKRAVKDSADCAKRWKSDIEMGRQMLVGPNPIAVHACMILGERWSGASALPSHIFNGDSLESVVTNNKIYEINNDMLKGVDNGGQLSDLLCGVPHTWYCFLADCLFYVDAEDNLRPFLIRLHYANEDHAPTFWYPPPDGAAEDSPEYLKWQMAKIYFRSADCNSYSLCTHFARAHYLNESFAVSMYRQLPRAHPLHKLMHPHLAGIIPINVQARMFLTKAGRSAFSMFLAAGDSNNTVMENYFRNLKYESLIIPKDFEARGVTDIPKFYFKDDASASWGALHQYVTELLELSYQSDCDVEGDEELRAFTADIAEQGLGKIGGCGFPKHVTTIPALADLITVIIFNVSVFHAAVNFQTMTTFGFIPNAAGCMIKPPPLQGEEITMERIIQSLPVEEITFAQLNTSYNLGAFSPTEKFYLETRCEEKSGMLGECMLVGDKEVGCLDRLGERMRAVRDAITARNNSIEIPYDVISPDNVPLTTQT